MQPRSTNMKRLMSCSSTNHSVIEDATRSKLSPVAAPPITVVRIIVSGTKGSNVMSPLRPRSWKRFTCSALPIHPMRNNGTPNVMPIEEMSCIMSAGVFGGGPDGIVSSPSVNSSIAPPKPAMRQPSQYWTRLMRPLKPNRRETTSRRSRA